MVILIIRCISGFTTSAVLSIIIKNSCISLLCGDMLFTLLNHHIYMLATQYINDYTVEDLTALFNLLGLDKLDVFPIIKTLQLNFQVDKFKYADSVIDKELKDAVNINEKLMDDKSKLVNLKKETLGLEPGLKKDINDKLIGDIEPNLNDKEATNITEISKKDRLHAEERYNAVKKYFKEKSAE